MKQDTEMGPTDSAALAGGVVAVAMTTFAEPGPYDLIGATVGVTLIVVIWAYLANHRRSFWQSGAVAAVIGLVAVLPFGALADLICPGANCDPVSRQCDSVLAGRGEPAIWLAVGGAFWIFDRVRQKRAGA